MSTPSSETPLYPRRSLTDPEDVAAIREFAEKASEGVDPVAAAEIADILNCDPADEEAAKRGQALIEMPNWVSSALPKTETPVNQGMNIDPNDPSRNLPVEEGIIPGHWDINNRWIPATRPASSVKSPEAKSE